METKFKILFALIIFLSTLPKIVKLRQTRKELKRIERELKIIRFRV